MQLGSEGGEEARQRQQQAADERDEPGRSPPPRHQRARCARDAHADRARPHRVELCARQTVGN